MSTITVRVPATSANLGPGYDALGVALRLYNSVTVSRAPSGREAAEAAAPHAGAGLAKHPMAQQAALRFFEASGATAFPFDCSVAGEVPRARGLGSSVTVRLGLLHGLNGLAGNPLDATALFHLCAELEGHPDNAAPAAFGGFAVAGGLEVARFPVASELKFVLLVPDFEVATAEARKVLPAQLERWGAVRSCANACRVTAAFALQRYALLRGAFEDHLHQPFREAALIPFLSEVIRAGEGAGALGGFLSGSGSTICCVTLADPERVGAAMHAAAGRAHGAIFITTADNDGVR